MATMTSRPRRTECRMAAFVLVVVIPMAAGAGEPGSVNPDSTPPRISLPITKQPEASTVRAGAQWLTPLEVIKFAIVSAEGGLADTVLARKGTRPTTA